VMKLPALRSLRRTLLADFGIPDDVIEYVALTAQFDTRDTERALEGSGIEVPDLDTYADKLWDYWERNLAPDLFKDRSFEAAIDLIANNAGRSIRRGIALSLDRFHDFERTMALNYFGTIKLTMGLLPHMRERGHGHVVNVSSIGVQTNPPRFSAYVASKAALDAWTRVVSSEVIGDGITFTTIHMPLVRTPMIAPTKIYDSFPTI